MFEVLNSRHFRSLVCRICLSYINDDNFKSIEECLENESILDMLALCVPEMNSKISYNAVICEFCIAELLNSYKFKHKCLETEDIINNYIKETENKDSVDLAEIISENIINGDLHEHHNNSFQQENENSYNSVDNSTDNNLVINTEYEDEEDDFDDEEEEESLEAPNKVTESGENTFRDRIPFHTVLKMARNGKISRQGNCKPSTCIYCSETFHSVKLLHLHIKANHPGQHLYCCEVCGKKFTRQSSYSQHKTNNHDLNPYKCEKCNKTFKYKKKLDYHVLTKHNNPEAEVTCPICDKVFDNIDMLKAHKLAHNFRSKPVGRPVKIPVKIPVKMPVKMQVNNGKVLKSTKFAPKLVPAPPKRRGRVPKVVKPVSSRTRGKPRPPVKEATPEHEEPPPNTKTFDCSVCGMSFPKYILMQKHYRTHKTMRYSCAHCPRRCFSKTKLRDHITKAHERKGRFICDICQKACNTKASLIMHMRIHNGVKK